MNLQRIKSYMDELTQWIIPGNSICIYYKNQELFRYSSGYSDIERAIPMNGDELVNIYSCSKPLTVTAALQLFEKGRFLLTDPLYDYIPEFKEMYIKNEDGSLRKAKNPITIWNLFTMTAGFTYNTKSEAIENMRQKTNDKMNSIQLSEALAETPLAFEPGTHWNYSLCHDVLAAVVEVISGKSFRDYVKENILEPLDMNETFYHSSLETEKRMAQQYSFGTDDLCNKIAEKICPVENKINLMENVGLKNSLVLGTEHDCGGAGIITNASDYVKFANCLRNSGQAQNGEQIIGKATIDMMRTEQLASELQPDFDRFGHPGYGYGLGVKTVTDTVKGANPAFLGEFGWGGAAGSNFVINPEKELAYFYMQHILIKQDDFYLKRLNSEIYSSLD